ncbi:MAG: hypothetical protein Q9225_001725 [Loekoesia sp. 1 TL-2023]
MSLKRRIQISIVFLIGIIACVSAVMRLQYAIKLHMYTDFTYYGFLKGIWTIIEITSGMIVACMPILPRFVQALKQTRFFTQLYSSMQSLLQSPVISGQRGDKKDSSLFRLSTSTLNRSHGQCCAKSNQALSDEQRIDEEPREGPSDTPIKTSFVGKGLDIPAMSYTVEVQPTNEPWKESHTQHANGYADMWQDNRSIGSQSMV